MMVSSEQKVVSSENKGSEAMIRRINVCLLLIVLLFIVSPAQAQQPKKVPCIGYLTSSGRASFEAFATALRQLGYVEGKSVIFEFRTTENTAQLQPELAAEVSQLNVEVIVAVGQGPNSGDVERLVSRIGVVARVRDRQAADAETLQVTLEGVARGRAVPRLRGVRRGLPARARLA